MNRNFVESTLRGLTRALSDAMVSEQVASKPGFLQAFDPRVRLAGLVAMTVAAVLCRTIPAVTVFFVLATLIALCSRVSLATLAARVWALSLSFTGIIVAPALFLTPGESVLTLPVLSLTVTRPGLHAAAMLILRVGTAATLSTALVLCTPWNRILRALTSLRVPAEVVTMLAVTHRYVFLLTEIASQMFRSRESRAVGQLSGRQNRKMVSQTAGVLLTKSAEVSHAVYLAMLSRGFRGETRLISDLHMNVRDYAALAALLTVCIGGVWIGG